MENCTATVIRKLEISDGVTLEVVKGGVTIEYRRYNGTLFGIVKFDESDSDLALLRESLYNNLGCTGCNFWFPLILKSLNHLSSVTLPTVNRVQLL